MLKVRVYGDPLLGCKLDKMRDLYLIICVLQGALFSIQGESSFPYLSGYTLAFFCDWRMLGTDYASCAENFCAENVKLGDTIFVDYNRIDEFAKEMLPQIKEKIILISSNYGWDADNPLPGPFAYLLEEEKIAAWFVQNLDRACSEKLVPIPIGIANKHWDHGNTDLLNQFIPLSFTQKSKSIFCYLNYTQHEIRADCTAHFLKMGMNFEKPKTFSEYLKDLSESIFVISPPGNGVDCHRTWEALLMGCYPVVKSSTLNPLYEALPVVIVEDWNEVTEEFLKEKYSELNGQLWREDKLYAHFWLQKIKAIQDKIRAAPAIYE